jgi:plastocyanin
MMDRPTATLLATVVLMAACVGAGTAAATTGPAPYAVVNVSLKDTRIILSKLRVHDVTYVDFQVHNAGKLRHNFRIGGLGTSTLKPGQTEHLLVAFPAYGSYRFSCTVHPAPKMSGAFQVDRPIAP